MFPVGAGPFPIDRPAQGCTKVVIIRFQAVKIRRLLRPVQLGFSVLGEAQVSGTLKGDDVTIEFEVQGAKILYTGKLDSSGRSMKGKVDLAGMASGTFTATRKVV